MALARRRLILEFAVGVTLAAIAFFVWSAISWMVLPWQRGVFKEFRDEEAVARALDANTPRSGVYGLPGEPRYPQDATREQREAIDRDALARIRRGPIVFAVVGRGGLPGLPRLLVQAFLGNLAVSAVFAWMLAQTSGLGYGERVAFLFLAGIAAGIACRYPDWNWHRFPLDHTVVSVASLATGWLLSGLVLALFVHGKP
jgi:hypothetical protein